MSDKLWKLRYNEWLNHAETDGELKSELSQIPESGLSDAFYKELEFGTGGLRCVMGAGTNRLNKYTVIRATKGFAAYLNAHYASPSCAVSYDTRLKSDKFAKYAAAALADKGVKVYIFPKPYPTPMLSFAVRFLRASAGIVITASHNPAEYNGYKVYASDGCQITAKAADEISACIASEAYFSGEADFDALLRKGIIEYISGETEAAFYDAVMKTGVISPQTPVKIAYSPLNGTGLLPVLSILKMAGNTEVFTVKEQEQPDGNFPTCKKPNPELPGAMKLVCALCAKKGADVCIATDPDADRIGAAIPENGGFRLFTGNEIGLILFNFLCEVRSENNMMPENAVAVKSIVTAETAVKIAEKYNVELINVLTGFKYIGEQITALKNESGRFIFGFEESCGYLAGDYIRDKDAVGAALLIVRAVSYYKGKGLSLSDALLNIYKEFGFEKTRLLDFTYKGEQGAKTMNNIMSCLRSRNAGIFSGETPESATDYLYGDTGLPKSDMISFSAPGKSAVVRPSGTEPKIKIYLTAVCSREKEAENEIRKMADNITALIKSAAEEN